MQTMTCSDCGKAFDTGGLTDGNLTICPVCSFYLEEDGEFNELNPEDFKHGRRYFYGGGR